jgi:FAD:protein FMN transferase
VIGAPRWQEVWMDTVVAIQVAVPAEAAPRYHAAVRSAFDWFARVEAACSRFDPASEVCGLLGRVGEPVRVSAVLLECVAVALELAEATGGAFDPAVGHLLEARGFDRHYRTGLTFRSGIEPCARPSFRDVELDRDAGTITLHRPLLLDLGAIAKGLAVDLAAEQLARLAPGVAVDAGGDCLVRGSTTTGRPWRVGIQHPRESERLLTVVEVPAGAVCTSGGYARRGHGPLHAQHLIDARSGRAVAGIASATVVAPTALAADALATAALLLGPTGGLRLLEASGVEGLLVTADLEPVATSGFGALVVGVARSQGTLPA